MRTNIICFSDFHWHNWSTFAKPQIFNYNGKDIEATDRLVAQWNTIEKIFELADEHNAHIVFAGDYYHARKRVESLVFNMGFNAIKENMAKRPDLELFMVVGNHDQQDSSRLPEHSLEQFKAIDNVFVLDDFEIYQTDNVTIYPVSYSDDVDFLKDQIDRYAQHATQSDNLTMLVAHLGVDGSETGRHSHRLGGAFSLADLHPDTFTYIVLGHYHKRQYLGNRDNAFYCGNPIQESFSDEGQVKGVFLVNGVAYEKPAFIEIPNKQFITITEIDENTEATVANHYVRFVIPQELAVEVAAITEDVPTARIEVQREFKSEVRIDIKVDSTEEDIVDAYTDEFYPNTKTKALAIIKEAKQRKAEIDNE
ncbi:hypothetical protein BCPG3_204 [Bacillus phage BCPG3]|nr:putative exonuclease [Bacillus phage BCPG1]QSJ04521.1 hypothetical protein BCPG3_204 [Bacillus phage BCPG3]